MWIVDVQSFAPIGLHKTDTAFDWLLIKYAENFNIIVTFLRQSDKFIITRVVTGQKFLKLSDDIVPLTSACSTCQREKV